MSKLTFQNTYADDLTGLYAPWHGSHAPDPKIIAFNTDLAASLGLSDLDAAMLAGSDIPDSSVPLAMAYSGHQFGHFSAQLGDGRAMLLGEVLDEQGRRFDLHLKGSGRTPFSRGGDGKAVIGPVLREYLMGEAMHALGIPTTRALAATLTGEMIEREGPKPGAVLARIASSHIRVGTFQFFAAQNEGDKLQRLTDYTIARHYPDASGPLGLLQEVVSIQAKLIADWMLIGFVHGVMNTDNMTISGETIDYGPCAFLDTYDPETVFSSIDRRGRYAYGNQPNIAQWNLARLAEALLPLVGDKVEEATDILHSFTDLYRTHWLAGMRDKLGLREVDEPLIDDLMDLLKGVDYTLFFRMLTDDPDKVPDLFLGGEIKAWLAHWHQRRSGNWQSIMAKTNPIYIPRNHMVEAALSAAQSGDMAPFNEMLEVVKNPYQRQNGKDAYANPDPQSAPYVTFCGT